jgi:REP element-mobilizing transposase RayT
MSYDPRLHHRRSIRLRGHDYAGGGAYFVTICTQGKQCLFGEIVEGEMVLNEAGRLVHKIWDDLPRRFGTMVLDAFQMMPNHLHAIFVLPGPGLEPALAVATGARIIQPVAGVGAGLAPPTRPDDVGAGLALPSATTALTKLGTASRPPTSRRVSMGDVVGSFKSIATIAVNRLMSRPGRRLLQTNFYEHIIRDVKELEVTRDYVVHNPQRWLEDPDNPDVGVGLAPPGRDVW